MLIFFNFLTLCNELIFNLMPCRLHFTKEIHGACLLKFFSPLIVLLLEISDTDLCMNICCLAFNSSSFLLAAFYKNHALWWADQEASITFLTHISLENFMKLFHSRYDIISN